MSHNCFVYLDDGISGHRDKVSTRAASLVQRSDLSSSGLVQNESKSLWEPVQVGEWFGFLNNTIQHIFSGSRGQESLILDGFSTPRELASVAGFITSISLAVGPIARLFTRQMHFCIQSRSSWDASFVFFRGLIARIEILARAY